MPNYNGRPTAANALHDYETIAELLEMGASNESINRIIGCKNTKINMVRAAVRAAKENNPDIIHNGTPPTLVMWAEKKYGVDLTKKEPTVVIRNEPAAPSVDLDTVVRQLDILTSSVMQFQKEVLKAMQDMTEAVCTRINAVGVTVCELPTVEDIKDINRGIDVNSDVIRAEVAKVTEGIGLVAKRLK